MYFLHLASWFQCYQLNVTVTGQLWQTFLKIIIFKGVEIGHFLLFFLAQNESEFEKVDNYFESFYFVHFLQKVSTYFTYS